MGRTWTDVMARRLQIEFPDLWVNNAGLDGQSTYGHIVLLQEFVVALRPKIAVFLIGSNDVGLGRTNAFDAAMTPDTSNRWHAVKTFLIDHSELSALAQNIYRAYRTHEAGFGHTEVDLRTAHHFKLDERTIELELQRHQREYLESYAKRVAAIVSICRRSSIEPVLVTHPALFGAVVDPSTGVDLTTVQVSGGANGTMAWRRLELYNDVTRRVASREGVALIDLAREMPKDSVLYYDFMHFTNAGAEQAGVLLSAQLSQYLRRAALNP
jgi:hypothetical protein